MDPRSWLVVLAVVVVSCGKKESSVKTEGPDPGGAPTMPTMAGGNVDYDGCKACCDALMASSTDPEEGGAFRRAGAVCVTRSADVAMGKATKADVLSAITPMVPSGKLPEACK